MDTKNQSLAQIPAVRTYARDLENNRKIKSLPKESAVFVAEKEVVIPKTQATKKTIIKIPPQKHQPLTKAPTYTTSLPPLSTIQNKKKHPTKIIAVNSKNASFTVDDGDDISATIITDTKRDRFKLIPAMIASVKAWFADKKLAYKVKKTPKYTVPETTRRKGVIQKATGVNGKLATSDFSSIHERIRRRNENDDRPEPSTTWSPNTEPVFLLLEEPEIPAVSNVKMIARKSFRTPPEKFTVSENILPTTKPITATPTIAPIIVPALEVPPQVAIDPQPIKAEVEEIYPVTAAPEQEIETVEETKDEYEYYKEPASEGRPSYLRLLLLNTNTLALGVSGLVLALIITGVYSYYFVFSGASSYISEYISTDETMILDTTIMLARGEANDKSSLLKVLEIIKEDTNENVQVSFLFSGSEEKLIPPQILISIFGITLEKNLSRAISHLRIGYTRDKSPFMVIKTSDEIVARGGMLEWEATIEQDLSEIFDYKINRAAPAKFVDATLGGIDVRVLKGQSGEDLLIYGIKNNTVIITLDSFNFGELSNLIK